MPMRPITCVITGCLIMATAAAATSDRWNVPIAVKKLDNGLVVVVSEDHSSPTVGISVIYRVGIRTEPRNRTGFAHLFEHLMFEGTPNAPQGVFDRVTSGGGGDNNGSTHPDYTSYIEQAPVSALEPLLWLEADRMQTLAFTIKSLNNQRDVVKEEIRVNVKNQPYGGFAWTDLPQLAFQKWENGHDGYGSSTTYAVSIATSTARTMPCSASPVTSRPRRASLSRRNISGRFLRVPRRSGRMSASR
jgi:zinc protease